MKEYVKPDVFVTEFQLNSAVTACTPTSFDPEPQNITCSIKAGEAHGVFYNSCDTNASTNGRLVEYDGRTYFIWYDGTHTGKPSDEGQKLITALGVQAGEHAGIANAEIISIVNHS